MFRTEYEQLPFATKCCRWWRWMPMAYIKGWASVVAWACCGCRRFPRQDRWQSAQLVMQMRISWAQLNMRHCLTMEEAFANLKERNNQPQRKD